MQFFCPDQIYVRKQIIRHGSTTFLTTFFTPLLRGRYIDYGQRKKKTFSKLPLFRQEVLSVTVAKKKILGAFKSKIIESNEISNKSCAMCIAELGLQVKIIMKINSVPQVVPTGRLKLPIKCKNCLSLRKKGKLF